MLLSLVATCCIILRERDTAYRNSWWVGKTWIEMKWNAWNESIDMTWHEGIETHELKRMNCHQLIEMKELTWRNWSELIEANKLKWKNWNEGIETHELKHMNCHEWIEMNELTWRNWSELIEANKLKWKNWNEGIERHELSWMNWHERIEMNESKWVNSSEWIETNELKRMNSTEWMKWLTWHEWIDMKKWEKTLSSFYIFVWSTTWWWCGWHMKSSSRYSLAHILSTSSSKTKKMSVFFAISMWNRALATVSCTFCRPHLQKVQKNRAVLDDFYVINYLMTTWSTNEMKLSLQWGAHFVDLIVDLIIKKCEKPVFFWFLCQIELSLQSRAHFVPLTFKKLQKTWQYWTIFMWSTTWWRRGRLTETIGYQKKAGGLDQT